MDERDRSVGARGPGEPLSLSGASLEDELSVAADLAYLDLSAKEREALAQSVGRMLEFFATMDGFPPPAEGFVAPKSENRLRADRCEAFTGADLIDAAPQREERLVRIPNIL